jgi:MFS family permease
VAIGWQIFLLRHQPFDLGLLGLVLFLPQALLAFPAGFIADRFDRRLVCIVCVLVQALTMAMFAWLAHTGTKSLGVYLAVAAVFGTAYAIDAPSERSLLATIVHGDNFLRAQALTSSISQFISISSPALGGALLLLGTPVAFGTAAVGYLGVAAAFAVLRPRGEASSALTMLQGAGEALRFILARKVLLGAISLDLFAVLFGGATALLPVYADSILHVGPAGLGLLRSAPALGSALVAAMLVRRPLQRHVGRTLFLTVAGFGVSTIAFGLSRNLWLSLLALAATGGFDMVSVVIRVGIVQLRTPNALRGRVSALENVFIGASNELGEFESGTLAQFAGTPASVVIGGIGTLVVIGLWAVLFPPLRRFDRMDEAEEVQQEGAGAPD